jgi:hypothetical protein
LSPEVEEKTVLGAVTMQLLVKTYGLEKDLAYALVICKVWRSAMAFVIKCNYELYVNVVNKSNIQFKTQSTAIHISDNIYTYVCVYVYQLNTRTSIF